MEFLELNEFDIFNRSYTGEEINCARMLYSSRSELRTKTQSLFGIDHDVYKLRQEFDYRY